MNPSMLNGKVRLDSIDPNYWVGEERGKVLAQHACLASLIQACASEAPKQHSMPVESLEAVLLRHFNACRDGFVSCHLADLISIFAIHINLADGVLAEITWDAQRAKHTVRDVGGNLPYALFKLHHAIVDSAKKESDSVQTTLLKEAFLPLFKTANTLQKSKDVNTTNFFHLHLAHWSALVIDDTNQYEYLTELCTSLEETLLNIDRKAKQRPRDNGLPGLNEKTYSSLFELVLQMTTTSLSLSKPQGFKLTSESPSIDDNNPYNEIIAALEIFRRVISTFQSNHFILPRRMFFSVVKSSMLVTKLCDYQMRRCVEWRSSKHLHHYRHANSFAEVHFLQPLIDFKLHWRYRFVLQCHETDYGCSRSKLQTYQGHCGSIVSLRGCQRDTARDMSVSEPHYTSASVHAKCIQWISCRIAQEESQRRRSRLCQKEKTTR
jgi:hypothetical protein